MARYRIGEQTFKRKNLYLPCAISADLGGMTEEEKARAYRDTWWLDNITNAEWPVVLGEPEATRPNRSRLKRKTVGWPMAMSRIAALNPELFAQAVQEAIKTHQDVLKWDGPLAPWLKAYLEFELKYRTKEVAP